MSTISILVDSLYYCSINSPRFGATTGADTNSRRVAFGKVAFGKVAFGKVAFGKVAFGKVAFGKVAFGKVAFGVMVGGGGKDIVGGGGKGAYVCAGGKDIVSASFSADNKAGGKPSVLLTNGIAMLMLVFSATGGVASWPGRGTVLKPGTGLISISIGPWLATQGARVNSFATVFNLPDTAPAGAVKTGLTGGVGRGLRETLTPTSFLKGPV